MCGNPQERQYSQKANFPPLLIPKENIQWNKCFAALTWHFSRALPLTRGHRPQASSSQWISRYRPAIIWTGKRGENGSLLSWLFLPLALIHQTEEPMADWQHPSTPLPTHLPLIRAALLPAFSFRSSLYFVFILQLLFLLYVFMFMYVCKKEVFQVRVVLNSIIGNWISMVFWKHFTSYLNSFLSSTEDSNVFWMK